MVNENLGCCTNFVSVIITTSDTPRGSKFFCRSILKSSSCRHWFVLFVDFKCSPWTNHNYVLPIDSLRRYSHHPIVFHWVERGCLINHSRVHAGKCAPSGFVQLYLIIRRHKNKRTEQINSYMTKTNLIPRRVSEIAIITQSLCNTQKCILPCSMMYAIVKWCSMVYWK